jgi:hypothetical protein
MTRSGRAVLVVEVDVLADLVEDALNDLVDDPIQNPDAVTLPESQD